MNAWNCCQCGYEMDGEMGETAERELKRLAAVVGKVARPLLHMCAKCQALHFYESGTLRQLTVAEQFHVQCDIGPMIEAASAGLLPTRKLLIQDH